jgi:AmmeMemoRadiSam system protein A/AmmeMemoRadiSam system protein B
MSFEGASIYSSGNYITPLGKVQVNLGLAKKLVTENPVFNTSKEPHAHEHSLEVQLPFLQYHLDNEFTIIPIILGTNDAKTCEKIGKALKPYLREGNLFVISTDFSHYPSYEEATLVDHATANSITRNSPGFLLQTLESNDDKGYDNLATSLCGWTSVLSLLYMTEGVEDVQYRLIEYKNSGDSKLYGDKDRVVGYCSIVLEQSKSQGNTGFYLTPEEKADLLNIARNTITEYVNHGKSPEFDESKFTDNISQPCGAFVTLRKEGLLRGCIGRFEAVEPLYDVVRQMAISASTQDYRFPIVTPDEVDELDIEISVLTPMKLITSIDEIDMGRHGIYIKKGLASGTFLPQVATETGWTKEEFLGHCAKDKAHIGWDGWKDAEIYIYEAYVFSEHELE